MGFGAAIRACFSKYVTFSGRACRSELWYFMLFAVIGYIVAAVLDNVLGTTYATGNGGHMVYGYLYSLWGLALLLPTISVHVRRLHDRGRSGWWWWLYLIPVVGAIWLLVWFCQRGTQGDNRFGPNPLASGPSAAQA